ncbi:MAG: response regulator, partial [Parcubacteria group bacterium]|nr:response regulator [Parcubacteria group bacterium]
NLGEAGDINEAKRLGANEYIIKAHLLPSEVVEVIKKYL